MAFGVALSVKADLGISPISCIPYIYSIPFSLTMGETTIIFNALLILCQIIILRKNYKLFQLLQFPVIFIFGFFIDFTNYLASTMQVSSYWQQFILCLLSCIVLSIGVFLEIKANITYLPGEGVAMALSKTFNINFGKAKIGTDISLVLVGIVSSLLLFKSIVGIREGTIIAAVMVGFFVKTLNKNIQLPNYLRSAEKQIIEPVEIEIND